ncbi:MAG: hypothetical protein K6G52_05950 [Treponemataceae bacterium]|nr:hypothetical protein [Treponemataceae bacterium]
MKGKIKFTTRNAVLSSVALFLLLVFVAGCGLDVYYILEPVEEATTPSSYDALSRIFSFRTNDEANTSDIYLGVDVFYKIYNNYSALTSDTTTITNACSEYTENGYNKMISLGYCQMKFSNSQNPTVEDIGYNRSVTIRLFSEGLVNGAYSYPACITASGYPYYDGADYAIPLRDDGLNTFNFFPEDSSETYVTVNGKKYYHSTPVSTDSDVKISSSDDGKWYVNAYVASVGRLSTLTERFSDLTYLGYMQIEDDD